MQYRKFGKLDFEVSALGFGVMRMPLVDRHLPIHMERDIGKIDEEESIKMIHYAIDQGINYIDTAYPYHKGNSEPLVAKALKNGYREKVKLATKLPVWLVESYEDFEKYLDEQLQKLDTEYIDIYLLHSLNKHTWNKIKNLGVLDFLEAAVKKGKIKHIGFSFHDKLEVFKEIVDSYKWDVCQIQLNYMDEYYQAGIEGLRYAAQKDIAVIVMEPLRGGKLVKNIPEEVKSVWNEADIKRTPAEWAFKWLLNHEEVTLVLSGMNSMEDIMENLSTAQESLPNSLTEQELATVARVKELYLQKVRVSCTDCGYCIPCPVSIPIPDIFTLYNNVAMYRTKNEANNSYQRIIANDKDATFCLECGECDEACPQDIPIMEALKEAHLNLKPESLY